MNAVLQSLLLIVRPVRHRLPRSSSNNSPAKRQTVISPNITITNQSLLSHRRHVPVHLVVALPNNSQITVILQVTMAVPLLVIINRAAIGIILDYRMLWQVVRFGKIIQVGGYVVRFILYCRLFSYQHEFQFLYFAL